MLWHDMLEASQYVVTAGSPNTVQSINNIVSGTPWTEASNPPEFEHAGLNGRPCMRFDGTARRLVSTDAPVVATFSGTDKPFTVITVIEPLVPDSTQIYFCPCSSAAATFPSVEFRTTLGTTWRWDCAKRSDTSTSNFLTRAATLPVPQAPQVVTWVVPGATGSIYVNQEATPSPNGASFTLGSITPDRVSYGCRADSSADGFFNGRIGCHLVWDRALETWEHRGIAAALRAGWQL